eukprot:9207095-Pyramimonas_sp.AAC.1
MSKYSLPHPEAGRKSGPGVSLEASYPCLTLKAKTIATASRMEGGPFRKCGSRRGALHMCLTHI